MHWEVRVPSPTVSKVCDISFLFRCLNGGLKDIFPNSFPPSIQKGRITEVFSGTMPYLYKVRQWVIKHLLKVNPLNISSPVNCSYSSTSPPAERTQGDRAKFPLPRTLNRVRSQHAGDL